MKKLIHIKIQFILLFGFLFVQHLGAQNFKANVIGSLSSNKFIGINASVMDDSGNIYIAGIYLDTFDFDLGPKKLLPPKPSSVDGFFGKYDSLGNLKWIKFINGPGSETMNTLVRLHSGDIAVGGVFTNAVDMDPGNGSVVFAAKGSSDGFIIKCNGQGDFVWAKQFVGSYNVNVSRIIESKSDFLYAELLFDENLDANPGTDSFILKSPKKGLSNYGVVKLQANGTFAWARHIVPGNNLSNFSMALDAKNRVFLGGDFSDSVNFNSQQGVFMKKKYNSNGYLVSYDSNGVLLNSTLFCNGTVRKIRFDNSNNMYVTGGFNGLNDFDFGAGTVNRVTAGLNDVFIAKYDENFNFINIKNFGGQEADEGRDILITKDNFIYISGIYSKTVKFNPPATYNSYTAWGFLDNFLIKYDTAFNFIGVTVLGSKNNETGLHLSSNNSGKVIAVGFFGSDSLWITKGGSNKKIKNNGTNNQYFFNLGKCDSKGTTENQTACKSFTWVGTKYTNSGVYYANVPNAEGCDSLLTLNLSIKKVNTNANISGGILEAEEKTATAYQWFYCDSNKAISNATSHTFIAPKNAKYAVAITKDGCTDTSICYQIVAASIGFYGSEITPQIAPNPVENTMRIINAEWVVSAEIYSQDGRFIQTFEPNQFSNIPVNMLPLGMYILKLNRLTMEPIYLRFCKD